MISHAIFASSHPTPARTALSSTPPPTPRFAPPRAALRLSLCPSHYLPPCTPLCIPPELHPAPSTPLFTLLCVALHPPSTPSCPSPCAPTPFHTTHFHRTSLLHRIPLAQSLPPRHSIFLPSANFPSACLSILRVTQPRLWIFSCVKRPGSLTT